jgi:tRNA-2-methylthio-N6-dimethylallyladenosine synthase
MKHYHIWTIGCQMNEADSGRVAAELDALGYAPTDAVADADVIVLNTCVVRQSAEDKAVGHLTSLRPLKTQDPHRVIALMGCMVGIKPNPALVQRFPFVDVFMPPSEPGPLVAYLADRRDEIEAKELDEDLIVARHAFQDDASPEAAAIGLIEDHADAWQAPDQHDVTVSPPHPVTLSPGHPFQSLRHLSLRGQTPIAANVPIVYGCSHACAFCIIPFRRGVERSRPLEEIVAEVRGLVAQGVREVTLLGQIVDRYGKDFAPCPEQRGMLSTSSGNAGGEPVEPHPSTSSGPDLADLLAAIHEIEGLWRIRFLTSHPNYMTDRILRAVAELPKVCEQIEVPVQAGDDDVLAAMKRGYTQADYRRLISHIREIIPNTAIHTDIIVGFPGETAEQFQKTYDLLTELKLDKAHLAMYSPRPGTVSARRMTDDVPAEEKKRRWDALDALQGQVVGEINRRSLGKTVEVLVEDLHKKGRWRGRTRTNKLVFFADEADWRGKLANVRITWTGPWSMIGEVERSAQCVVRSA